MNNLYYNNKKLKKIKNKRSQKTKKVWGWILTVIGGMELLTGLMNFEVSSLIGALFFLIPGLILVLSARRQVNKWDQYEAIIDNMGNTPISLIAKKMGLSERAVYSDLQEMILNDFFIGPNYNIEPYIDAERDMLVMTSGGKPLRPVPDIPKEESAGEEAPADAAFQSSAAQEEEAAADEDAAETIAEEMSDLDMIRQVIARTGDEETRGYLYGIEGSLRRIDERVQSNPQLKAKTSIKRLYKFYLPQIMDLIRKYQAPDTPADIKKQIKEALKTSAGALSNIEADFLEKDQMNVEVDIEVLKNMFAQDGLLGRAEDSAAQAQRQARPQPAAQAQPAGQAAQAQPAAAQPQVRGK